MSGCSFISNFHRICEDISALGLSKPKKQKWSILSEGAKNTHLEHIEDELINQGADGVRRALDLFRELLATMAGHTDRPINITTKWDGAPAIFAGTDPMDGKFFVGTKGVFARDSKMNKSLDDIRRNHEHPGLQKKLAVALDSLKNLGIKGYVLQGDMLFTHDSIQKVTIDDKKYISFTPNTITYAVPLDNSGSQLAAAMMAAKIGIVFHTIYTGGPTIHDMEASFGFSASELQTSDDVWFSDATFKDVSGQLNLTKSERSSVRDMIDDCTTHFGQIENMLYFLDRQDHMSSLNVDLKAHINSSIREHHEFEEDSREFATTFIQKFSDTSMKAIDRLKTERGQTKRRNAMVKAVEFLEDNKENIIRMYDLYLKIVDIKSVFVAKLSNLRAMDSFLEQPDGSFVVTKPEGFVAVDHMGNAIKLIDRGEFSAANFGTGKPGAEPVVVKEVYTNPEDQAPGKTFADYYNNKEHVDFAIVPGSFKPPHRGHYEMVERYSTLADQVIVLISNPTEKSVRRTSMGTIITPEIAKRVFDLYTEKLTNVNVYISDQPSPVGAAFKDLQENPIYKGKNVILGASKKDNDWKRWRSARDWAAKNNLPVNILDPEKSAVETTCNAGRPCSASSIRNNITDIEILEQNIPPHVCAREVSNILSQ